MQLVERQGPHVYRFSVSHSLERPPKVCCNVPTTLALLQTRNPVTPRAPSPTCKKHLAGKGATIGVTTNALQLLLGGYCQEQRV
jgi:hypothetical protein